MADQGDHLDALARRQLDDALECRARVETGADRLTERLAGEECCRCGGAAANAEEMGAISRPGRLPTQEVGKGDPTGESRAPGIAGQNGAGRRIERGDDEGGVGAARGAHDPLGIGGDAEPAGPA